MLSTAYHNSTPKTQGFLVHPVFPRKNRVRCKASSGLISPIKGGHVLQNKQASVRDTLVQFPSRRAGSVSSYRTNRYPRAYVEVEKRGTQAQPCGCVKRA